MFALMIVFLSLFLVLATCSYYVEINRLRDAIRKHRDQRLDDRCWEDDIELYEVLPEGADPRYIDLRLLPKEVMMVNCDRFTTCRTLAATPEEAIAIYKQLKKIDDDNR